MKASQKTVKLKTRITSIVICLALVLCAILSFGFALPRGRADGEENTPASTQENNVGVRFVQVAAGEDFAIGLTYDGKIYGWSLDPDKASKTGFNVSATSLGGYYTTTPTEIKFDFRVGPGANGTNGWGTTEYRQTYTSFNSDPKNTTKLSDSVKSIAATRKTAALITTSGYIYTWGRDMYENGDADAYISDMAGTRYPNYLLLRALSDSEESYWYSPYIINYNYGGNSNAAIKYFCPRYQGEGSNNIFNSRDVTINQIEASEYNYIISFTRDGKQYVYVWGSHLYALPNFQIKISTPYSFVQGSDEMNYSFDNLAVYQTTIGSLVAGGYNVGINDSTEISGGTSLRLRGRNFLTSQQGTDKSILPITDTVEFSVPTGGEPPATETWTGKSNLNYNSSTYKVLIGATGDQLSYSGGLITPKEATYFPNLYYGRQKGSVQFKNNGSQALVDSKGNPLNAVGNLSAVQYGASLGNDVGYGITSDGKIYGWGDDSVGQLGNQTYAEGTTKNQISPVEIGGLTGKVLAVAAGKQLSGTAKAFNATDTFSNGSFTDKTKNQAAFITGAVTGDGKLYVWSNEKTTPIPVAYAGVETVPAAGDTDEPNDSDKIIAVYSGYGNHVFAVTAVGKLMHIEWVDGAPGAEGHYKKTRYDDFGGVTNWAVNENNANIEFKAKTAPSVNEKGKPVAATFDTATFYVWGATSTATTAENTQLPFAYSPLVAENAIGDMYRIMGLGNEGQINNFINTNANDPTSGENPYAPKFYFGGSTSAMSAAQSANMFTAKVVYDGERGVGIEITPKRSSRGQRIMVEFYIARYNSKATFSATPNTGEGAVGYDITDKAVYYDIKKCSITFSIADTPTIKVYDAFRPGTEEGVTGNANLPVLDPNNVDNKFYSLALQDISTGVDALIAYLTSDATIADTIKTAIRTDMAAKDSGYPAKSKIATGNLGYYLGDDAAKFYNDSYQFLFFDGDGDRLISAGQASDVQFITTNGATAGAVEGGIQHITVTFKLPEGLPNTILTNFDSILTDFDNIYGIYNISSSNGNMSFTYDVLRFEGKASTGDMLYANEGSNVSVSSYRSTNTGKYFNTRLNIASYPVGFTRNEDNNSTHNPVTTNGNGIKLDAENTSTTISNLAAVFSQPTLRLNIKSNDKYIYGEAKVDGQKNALNSYTIKWPEPVYVGLGTTVELKDYISVLSETIQFSYDNSVSKYGDFEKQFIDETAIGNSKRKIVSLDGRSIVINPTTSKPINLTVAVQRFSVYNNQRTFSTTTTASEGSPSVTDYNEKVYLTLIFDNIVDFSFTETSANRTWTITKTETISLFGGNDSINNAYATLTTPDAKALERLTNSVNIVDFKTSEDNKTTGKLFTFEKTGNTSFTVTPLLSGTGSIQFIATVYGKSLFFSLTFNISKVTNINDTVIIVDDKYLYVSDIKTKLDQANSFNTDIDNYNILYNDIQNPEETSDIKKIYNALYFTNAAGEVSKPGFVNNVVFEGKTTENPTIRIVAGETSQDNSATFYLHIKFARGNYTTYAEAEAEQGNILEAVIPVQSGKIIIPVTIEINCKSPTDTEYVSFNETRGLDTQATINMAALLTSLNIEAAPNYDVFLVSSGSNTSNYFNYSPSANKKSVLITPVYNTPRGEDNQLEPIAVNVSMSNGTRYMVVSFHVTVDGILTTLPVSKSAGDGTVLGYGEIWLYSFLIVFGVLTIIFIARLIVYFRKRAKQRALIKRNQELIRMRDRMHNKANAASKEQIVKTKLKMEDPKYAKLFNDMRKNKEEESGIVLENSDLAATADKKTKKNKKKKGGKKTVAELKAELEAKKAAFAAAQQNAQPVNPFEADVPMGDPGFATPNDGYGDANGYGGDGFGDAGGFGDGGGFDAQPMDGNDIVFDASDLGDGM